MLSATTIFMGRDGTPAVVPLCERRLRRSQTGATGLGGALQVDLLGGADAGTQVDFMPELRQDNLERGQHGKQVQRVVITQVSQPKDLAPHGALSVGDD